MIISFEVKVLILFVISSILYSIAIVDDVVEVQCNNGNNYRSIAAIRTGAQTVESKLNDDLFKRSRNEQLLILFVISSILYNIAIVVDVVEVHYNTGNNF
jgi:hypothetical protein